MRYEVLVDKTENGLEEAEIVATYPTFGQAQNASRIYCQPTRARFYPRVSQAWIAETLFVGDTDEVIESTIIHHNTFTVFRG